MATTLQTFETAVGCMLPDWVVLSAYDMFGDSYRFRFVPKAVRQTRHFWTMLLDDRALVASGYSLQDYQSSLLRQFRRMERRLRDWKPVVPITGPWGCA